MGIETQADWLRRYVWVAHEVRGPNRTTHTSTECKNIFVKFFL